MIMNNLLLCLFYCIFFLLIISVKVDAKTCDCGLEKTSSRIVKGSRVSTSKYPWMAYIEIEKDGTYECTGVLIDEDHVITAAHCLCDDEGEKIDPEILLVYLGHSKKPESTVKGRSVSSFSIDSRYDAKDEYDFAILELSESVKFSKKIAPICIPSSDNKTEFNELTIAGYGAVDADGTSTSSLRHAQVDYISFSECKKMREAYIRKLMKAEDISETEADEAIGEISKIQICAINRKTGADSCFGDSGGPLMFKNPKNERWYLVGVVSSSWDGCGDPKIPGLYTSVFPFSQLIAENAENACIISY